MVDLFGIFGGFQNFMGQFSLFKSNVEQQGSDPKQAAYTKGQELLDSGKITQDQYNQVLNMAKMIRGFIH